MYSVGDKVRVISEDEMLALGMEPDNDCLFELADEVVTITGVDHKELEYEVLELGSPINHFEISEVVEYCTLEEPSDYAKDPNHCPRCKSVNCVGGDVEAHAIGVMRHHTCASCNFKWNEIYQLVGYEEDEVDIEKQTALDWLSALHTILASGGSVSKEELDELNEFIADTQ